MRPVDGDNLEKRMIAAGIKYSDEIGGHTAMKLLKEEPTLKRKTAYWIANNICSNCRKSVKGLAIQLKYYYCPHCGYLMSGTWHDLDKMNEGNDYE